MVCSLEFCTVHTTELHKLTLQQELLGRLLYCSGLLDDYKYCGRQSVWTNAAVVVVVESEVVVVVVDAFELVAVAAVVVVSAFVVAAEGADSVLAVAGTVFVVVVAVAVACTAADVIVVNLAEHLLQTC